jgi:putative nucleotidyltransferase with HDIG domain
MRPLILFVDDEERLLEGLKRSLHRYSQLWEMAFALGGTAALSFMENHSVDLLITDFRMAGMTGIALLKIVKSRFPKVIRVLFSGEIDQTLIMKSVKVAHQFISKPCPADSLKDKIEQALSLRYMVEEETLRALLSGIDSLPSLPALYGEIMAELKAPIPSIQKVGKIISNDIAMSSKILQLVNSAFFGLRQRVTSPEKATLLLGLDIVKSLVLSLEIFTKFKISKVFLPVVTHLWRHSLNTAKLAKRITEKENCSREMMDEAFMGGLLHDCGKIVMLSYFPEEMKKIAEMNPKSPHELLRAEASVFGVSHARIGAFLLGLWGIPDSITRAVSFHHSPTMAVEKDFSALTAIHLADYFDHYQTDGEGDKSSALLNRAYLDMIGCSALLEKEYDI